LVDFILVVPLSLHPFLFLLLLQLEH
jgi:hypothetical protein